MARLLQKSYKVKIICPPPTYPFTKYKKANYLFHNEMNNGISILRVWTFQPSKPSPSFFKRLLYYVTFPILSSIFLLILLHKTSFVIITTPPPSLLIMSLVTRLFHKKLILDIRDLWTDSVANIGYVSKDSIITKLTKRFETYCWKKSDLIISNSIIRMKIIKQVLGETNLPKIEYFPFNINLDVFKRSDVKRKRQIVYVGNFGVGQNLKALINAIPMILSKIPDLKIQLFGGGDCEMELKRLVRELRLEQVVEFSNPVPRSEIPEILSQSSLGIIPLLANNPYLRDAMPTKTFEYMACGLPVLAYGYSEELERVIRESGAGIYIKGDNHMEIANALLTMLSDDMILEEYSLKGRRFVEKTTEFPSL